MHDFINDLIIYIRKKRRRWQTKLSARCNRNVINMAVQDCGYSSIVKLAVNLSVICSTVRNLLKSAEGLNYAKLKANPKLQKPHIEARQSAFSNVLKFYH